MTLFALLLLSGAVVLGFFLLADGLIYIIANTGDRGEARRVRRLAIQKAEITEVRVEAIAREADDAKLTIRSWLNQLLVQADSTIPISRLLLIMAAIAVSTFLAELYLARWLPWPVQLVLALLLGVALPLLQLRSRASERSARFADQFPDALDLVVRSLRIGHPLAIAMQTIAKEAPSPTGPEFEIAARQVTYGKTTSEAIGALAKRINSPDVRFFHVAVQIHSESGGNLGDILAGLSKIIRSRFQLMRKVRALTAEGRFSAWFLSGFPIVMIFGMNALQPGYYEKVADYPLFPHLIALTVGLLIVNVFAMRMISKLEV